MKLLITTVFFFALTFHLLASPVAPAENPRERKPAAGRSAMIFKPNIQYPKQAKRAGWGGSGVVVLTVDPETGRVTGARMGKSTGHDVLDHAALQAFRLARFTKGAPKVVKVPVNFDPHF